MPCFNTIRTPAMPEDTKCESGFGGKPNKPRYRWALVMLPLAVIAVVVATVAVPKHAFLLLEPSSSRKIRGLNEIVSAPPPLANATTTTTTTVAPTRKPTGVPSEAPSQSPTCAANLPNNVTALAVVNLQFQPTFDDAVAVDTAFFIDQLAELFRDTYNRINNVKYTPCDEAYRRVTKVRHIEEKETNSTSYTPSSFVFRRRLLAGGEELGHDGGRDAAAKAEGNTPPKITTHYVRIGRSSDAHTQEGGGRRIQQQQQQQQVQVQEGAPDKWMHISLLFEATIACRGMFCIGDNAELFGPVVIDKNEFSRVYAQNVGRSLRWKPSATGNENSSGAVATTTSAPPAPPTAFVVETVREIEEQSCPLGDQEVGFTRIVIVEFVREASSDPFASPEDPRFEAIEEAYVSTYNQLIRNEFCDPFFRRLTKAEVVAVGRGQSNQLDIVSVEMRIFGECRGCDPSDIDVYAIPSVLVGPTKASSSSSARYLSNGDGSDGDKWLLPSPKRVHSEGRGLQGETSNLQDNETNRCYCDAQPFGNRAPFEAEFVSRFQRAVEALNLKDLSSVNSCQFGTTFSTGLVVSFSQEEVRKLQEAADKDTKKSVLELSLKDTLNELLTVTNQNCNKDFRVIENVTLVLGTNITRSSPSYIGGSNSGNEDLNLQLPSSTGPYSTIQIPTIKSVSTAAEISKRDSTLALTGGFHRRSVLEDDSVQQWKTPVVRIENHTASPSNATNCVDLATNQTLLNENHTTTDSNRTTIINCDETLYEHSDSPTYSPFDPAVMARKSDSVPILFFISGVCSGCDNSMFTGLGNDIVRKLGETSLTPSPYVLQPSKNSRGLDEEEVEEEEEERAKSDCFCPINATETSGELEASIVSKAYTANLEKESVVDSEVEILDEVDVVECEDAVQEFETTATLTLAGDLADSDIDALARSFEDTYNYLNALYCDPYFREITSIEDYAVFTRRRNRKSRKLQECSTETEIEFYIRGTCLGCDDGHPLFGDDGSHYDDRRNRNLKSLFESHKLSAVFDTENRRISRRRLQDSDVCFCEGDTIDDRAPSFDEFYSVYEEEALRVPEVCEVVEIEAEEDEDEDSAEHNSDEEFFGASEDYYEDFFRGSPAKEATVPPAFLIDDVLSEDLSSSSGDESVDPDEEEVDEETSSVSEDTQGDKDDKDVDETSSSGDASTELEDDEEDGDEEISSSSGDASADLEDDEEDADEGTSLSSGDAYSDLDDEEDVDKEASSLSGDESEDVDEETVDQDTSSSSGDESEDVDEETVDQDTSSSSGDESEDLVDDEEDVDQEISSSSGDASVDLEDDEEDVDQEISSSSGDASADLEDDGEDEEDVDQEISSSSGDASADLEDDEEDVNKETPSSSGDESTDPEDDEEDVDEETSSSSGDESSDLEDEDEDVDQETTPSSGDESEDLDEEDADE